MIVGGGIVRVVGYAVKGLLRDDDLQLDAPLDEMYPNKAGSVCRFPSSARGVTSGSGLLPRLRQG